MTIQQPSTVPVTFPILQQLKDEGKKFSALTAYDAAFAQLFDEAGIDLILVGDSLAMVIQGEKNTLPVTLEQIIYHTKCVTRTTHRALVVADMPFLSYHCSEAQAVESAGRLLKEGGAAGVKLEGGKEVAPFVAAITKFDIPVVGHIGLTPQSVHRFGGYTVQGKEEKNSQKKIGKKNAATIREAALSLVDAGISMLVVECIPDTLAAELQATLPIPVLGIGAGEKCDGQILVMHDLLGLTQGKKPRFVREFAKLGELAKEACTQYIQEIHAGSFPNSEERYQQKSSVVGALYSVKKVKG